MQTFFITHSLFINYRGSDFIRNIEVLQFVDILAKSKCQFDWSKKCLQGSHELLENLEKIILSTHPTIVTVMKYYIILYQKNMYILNNFQETIFLWCYLMKEKDSKWVTNSHTFNLNEMINIIYDEFFLKEQDNTPATITKEVINENGVLSV